ncbi:MAG: TonB-dependent receptor [Novosphingobium sp.]
MSRKTTLHLLAGASMLMMASVAQAQTSANPGSAAQEANAASKGEEANPADIVVTARRKDELLIDVPATVTAVTAQQLQDFQVNKFEDISTLVAGLTLDSDNSGFNARAQTRGVLFQVTSQGSPTVEQYLNEVPIEPNLMFASNYDIGQIEVLRGPQGTLRGRSAPSGAITSTTRRPDLAEFGGYGSFSLNSLRGLNLQGAVSLPIVSDVLSLRIAGLLDETDGGGVRSLNAGGKPHARTWSGRATLRFEPSSSFSGVVMYQRLVRDIHDYGGSLFGTGTVGNTAFANFTRPATSVACSGLTNCGNPAVFAPPNFNGGPIALGDYATVGDQINLTHQEAHIVTGQLDWRFGGQKLSYVGSYQNFVVQTYSDQDGNNTVVGRARFTSKGSDSTENRMSHELRLSSEEPLFDGLLDYTVGGFYLKLSGLSASEQRNAILMQGAFGSPLGAGTLPGGGTAPGTLSPFTYDRRYVVGFLINTPRKDIEKSIFGSISLHLGENTEFTAGARQIWRSATKQVDIVAEPGLAAILNPNGLGACPAQITSGTFLTGGGTVTGSVANPIPVVGQTYAGTCDIPVTLGYGAPATVVRPIPLGTRKWNPVVYNFSLSHKITPDLSVYASYGTAWRAGPGPITAAPTCSAAVTTPLPAGVDANQCESFNFLDPEDSKAIEIGVKAALFDRRLNLAVAAYRQTYSGLFILGGAVPYLSGNCAPPINTQVCTVSSGSFTYNAPAKAIGIDFDASLRLSEDFNMGLLFSWSRGKFNNARIPCRDSNRDGTPDGGTVTTDPAVWLANGGPYGPEICTVNSSSTNSPSWNLTLRGEYSHEIYRGNRGFIRGLVNYYPRNPNADVNSNAIIPGAYALVNLWLGLRGEKNDWELSLSAKNLFNQQSVLTQGIQQGTLITPQRNLPFGNTGTTASSGYTSITYTPRREFALNLRVAFGSR